MFQILLQVDSLELADIRDPIRIWSLTSLLLGILLILAICLGGYFIWRKRQQNAHTKVQEANRISPIEKAREAFKTLREKQPDLGDKAYISEVSGVMRAYLEDAYKLPAPERTTEEFFELLRSQAVFETSMQSQLMAFLQRSDLIKFARQELGANQREPLLKQAEEFVETAEQRLQRALVEERTQEAVAS